MIGISTYVRQNREKLTLVGYLVAMAVVAWPLAELFAEAWEVTQEDGGVANITIRLLRYGLFATILNDSHQTVVAAVFGLYLGLLALMTVDPKKRWQAFLLWLGTGAGLVGLQVQGLVLPQLSLLEQGPALVLGLGVGLALGGGRRLVELRDTDFLEFRRASRLLFWLLAGFVLVALFEVHVQYPGYRVPSDAALALDQYEVLDRSVAINGDGLLLNVAVAGVFVATIRRFVTYDADAEFFILGPRASGKSLFLIGAYLKALERVRQSSHDTPLEPSQDLMEMLEVLDREETEWLVEATGRAQVNYLSFQYVYGSVFPINVRLSAIDYAGEYLSVLPDAVSGSMPEAEQDETIGRLSTGVREADTLIFVIDIERFVNDEPLEIAEYFSILTATETTDVLLVATKADILAEEFGKEPHVNMDEFTDFVNDRLRQNENIDALVTETAGSEIHPVYYQTRKNENGNRVPVRDSTGTVVTVGYDRFLDRMGETV